MIHIFQGFSYVLEAEEQCALFIIKTSLLINFKYHTNRVICHLGSI